MNERRFDPLAVLPEALGPSDPYARTDDTFPTLSEEQVARVAEFGRVEELTAGTVLFEVDDRGVDFFLVLQGFIEILEPGDGAPQVMTVHAEHQFTGELDLFIEGGGIHYAATAMEAGLVEGEEAVVVGGGNSAGQAAIFLSRAASHVHVLVRGESLAASMSEYLVSRIDAVPERITLHRTTEITALHGDRHLEQVTWTNRATGEEQTRRVAGIFLMLGAAPNTEWLDGAVALDERGFVLTGEVAGGEAPAPLATSLRGVFAVGDVRAGSIKRVASAVGEGSVVISAVHQALRPG